MSIARETPAVRHSGDILARGVQVLESHRYGLCSLEVGMKILFQGGWKAGRDPEGIRDTIASYCRSLATFIVKHGHTVVLTSYRDFDKLIATEVVIASKAVSGSIKDHLLFLLPERVNAVPTEGRVIQLNKSRWWVEERTESVLYCDALIAIGGGKGTFDCVEKAILNNKPVFVAIAIPGLATDAWRMRAARYKYKFLTEKEAEILEDLNLKPDEFFEKVFSIIDKLAEINYPRRIFLVHGHDFSSRDALAEILHKLRFEPVILSDEPNRSRTIIEKLEMNTAQIGFAFVIYSPDDFGRAKNGEDRARARQNVIFEHGLVMGLLGRDRTCAILIGELEEPSDIKGMLFEQVGNIRDSALKIAKVLKDSGYSVDASALI
jgi:predicted nucleotide-binding protein